MAERRMFTQKITESDAFIEMPCSTQNFYFHLCMNADDDGFVNSPKKIQKIVGATDDDARILITKNFIIPFESGVIVIKHWRMHNQLRKDRYHPTDYYEEKCKLYLKSDGVYTLDETQGQKIVGNQMATEYSIGEYNISSLLKKENIYKSLENNARARGVELNLNTLHTSQKEQVDEVIDILFDAINNKDTVLTFNHVKCNSDYWIELVQSDIFYDVITHVVNKMLLVDDDTIKNRKYYILSVVSGIYETERL